MPDHFITIETLSSFPGMVLMVGLITQLMKRAIDRMFDNRTEYVVYAISVVLIFFTSFARGDLSGGPKDIFIVSVMNILNAVIVALAAMKGYEKILSEVDHDLYIRKVSKKRKH